MSEAGALDGLEPPANFRIEQALLGALLVNNNVYADVGDIVEAQHFADPLHGRIWEAAARLIERNTVVDCRTLQTFFENDETLLKADRRNYVSELAAGAISIMDAKDYAGQIRDLWTRRRLMQIGQSYALDAASPNVEMPASDLLDAMEADLFALREGEGASGPVAFTQAVRQAVDNAETAHRQQGVIGVASGLRDLDQILGGLGNGELIICGARPKIGKTTLLRSILENAAGYHRPGDSAAVPVGLFSMEMGADEVGRQAIARHSGISAQRQRTGQFSGSDWPRIVAAQEHLDRLPFYVDDSARLTPAILLSRLRRLKQKHGIRLAGVDYLQLMSAGQRHKSKYEEVSEISRNLKIIAKEVGIPLIVLSQLSRAVEQREDKRPGPEDLRDSGSIEQDANVVMFMYREEYYALKEEPHQRAGEDGGKFAARVDEWKERLARSRGRAELIVALSRSGPSGTAHIAFDGERSTCGDLVRMDRREAPPGYSAIPFRIDGG